MKSRDTFIFYRSIYESAQALNSDDRLAFYEAVMKFSLDFKESELGGVPEAFFTLVRPTLDKSNKGYVSGKKNNPTKHPKRVTPKHPTDNKDKDKDKDIYKPFFLSTEQMDNIITYRREIKKPLKTIRGKKGIETAFKECMSKYTFDEVFDTMLKKEWQSVKLEWLEKEIKPANNQIARKANPALGGYN